MKEIYRNTVWVYGAQVGLSSSGDPDAYPADWQSDDQPFISGPRGIAIATAPNDHIEIVVVTGDDENQGDLVASILLIVGDHGLDVGTPLDVETIAWPPGRSWLHVYSEGPHGHPHRVTFLLNPE